MTAAASFEALGTTATIVVADERALDRARAVLEAELAAIDAACSRFRRDSELNRANARPGRRTRITPLFAAALRASLDVAEWTGGAVSPVLGRSLRAAGYDRTFRLVRERERWELAPVAPPREAWRALVLDDERLEVTVPVGVELDLGATAKALAADRSAAAAATATGSGVLVSLGGDVAVAGEPPAGGWVVGVADDHAAPAQATVAVARGGLATSSTTVRRWTTDRGEAHHILDPLTGAPAASRWRTVSVAAPSCVYANGAATAAIVLDGRGLDWLSAHRLPARLVDGDGRVVTVAGWPSDEAAA